VEFARDLLNFFTASPFQKGDKRFKPSQYDDSSDSDKFIPPFCKGRLGGICAPPFLIFDLALSRQCARMKHFLGFEFARREALAMTVFK
jgi:hypothetical protein